MSWAKSKAYDKGAEFAGRVEVEPSRFFLEVLAPLSGRWFQSGPSFSSERSARDCFDELRRCRGSVQCRIVDQAGTVLDTYRPEFS